MASKYFPRFPIDRQIKDGQTPHESALWLCFAAHGGVKDLRDQFMQRKAEIEERGKNGELGPVGIQKELKKLAAEFEPRLRSLGALVDKARQHHNSVREKLTARAAPKASASADEAVRRAFQEHRVIQRFEGLTPAERREAVRLAAEKRDAGFLGALLHEPGLLDERTARQIETVLMGQADKALYREFEELGGKLNAHGDLDAPHESPLAVAAYVLDDTRQWIDEQVGGLDARSVLDRAGVALDQPVLLLSAEQAKDPALYRAAREVAAADRRVLSVSGDVGATGRITPEDGQ